MVEQAVKLGLADAKVVVADLTAQEAAIPDPNEMGLLGGFVRSLEHPGPDDDDHAGVSEATPNR